MWPHWSKNAKESALLWMEIGACEGELAGSRCRYAKIESDIRLIPKFCCRLSDYRLSSRRFPGIELFRSEVTYTLSAFDYDEFANGTMPVKSFKVYGFAKIKHHGIGPKNLLQLF